MYPKETFILTGIFLILLLILVTIRNLRSKDYTLFFWFCEISPIILSIGFLTENIQLIKSVINIGLFPQIVSLVFLTIAVLFKQDVSVFKGIRKKGKLYITVSYLLHLFSVILAFILTSSFRATRISLVYSFIILSIVFTLSILFTPAHRNINFVQNLDFLNFKHRFYKYFWIAKSFILIVIPTYYLQNYLTSLLG